MIKHIYLSLRNQYTKELRDRSLITGGRGGGYKSVPWGGGGGLKSLTPAKKSGRGGKCFGHTDGVGGTQSLGAFLKQTLEVLAML